MQLHNHQSSLLALGMATPWCLSPQFETFSNGIGFSGALLFVPVGDSSYNNSQYHCIRTSILPSYPSQGPIQSYSRTDLLFIMQSCSPTLFIRRYFYRNNKLFYTCHPSNWSNTEFGQSLQTLILELQFGACAHGSVLGAGNWIVHWHYQPCKFYPRFYPISIHLDPLPYMFATSSRITQYFLNC